ncbi:MAG: molybdopterin-dependent oxidoreductase [Blastocatellia bacterium]|nr:molybdopterin-dependent oxidoreductase [Blastocatellia bacterium]
MKLIFSFLIFLFVANMTATETALTISGEVEKSLSLTVADLEKLSVETVEVKGHDGKQAAYTGTPVYQLLKLAGAKMGKDFRGKDAAYYLVVEATDGYQVVVAIPELDPEFSDRKILLAYKKDGKPLEEFEGPFRLIVPDDKRQARWVRQVKSLTIKKP